MPASYLSKGGCRLGFFFLNSFSFKIIPRFYTSKKKRVLLLRNRKEEKDEEEDEVLKSRNFL